METKMQDIQEIGKKLMFKHPFYGFFLSALHKEIIYKEDEKMFKHIPTAAVGRNPSSYSYNIYINDEFWQALANADEKLDILRHELQHIVYGHPIMAKTYAEKEIFNIAADLQINQTLDNLPGSKMTFEEYLDFIENNKDDIKSGKVMPPFRACYLKDFGFDENTERMKGTKYYYDRLMQMKNQNSKYGNQLSRLVSGMKNGCAGGQNHDSWKEFDEQSTTQDNILQSQVDYVIKNLVEGNKGIGNIPAEFKQFIDNLINPAPPVIDWKTPFRNAIAFSTEYRIKTTRKKLNKRVEDFATIKLTPKKRIFTSVDTSGSMSDDDIKECFSEINNMWKAGLGVTVGECDAALNEKEDIYEFKGKYPTSRKGVSGRGGTDAQPCCDYFNKHSNKYCAWVHLTDGYVPQLRVKPRKRGIIVLTSTGASVEQCKELFPNCLIIKMTKSK